MKKILEKLKDRYNVLIFILSLAFSILIFKLASLTIIRGDELREISNNKKVKDIPITAPRGEIRDRYGRLLAGSKPSFTVQLIKDELKMDDTKSRNATILKLIYILEEEGISYKDEFPILFNSFRYKDDSAYFQTSQSPTDKIIDTIVENNLVVDLMGTYKQYSNNPRVEDFITGKKIINILENQGLNDIPIEVVKVDNSVEFKYIENKNIEKWIKENNLSPNIDARSAIISMINSYNTKKVVMKMISDPIISEIAYNILDSKGLVEDIKMEPISFSYDEEYKAIKRELVKNFKSVTMDSKAIDDFINILKEIDGIKELLGKSFVKNDTQNKNRKITTVPGEILLDILKENDIKAPIEVTVNEENNNVSYKYKSEKDKKKFLEQYNLSNDTSPLEAIIKISETKNVKEEDSKNRANKNHTIQEEFIKNDSIKDIAQGLILKKYSNLRISTSEWEYTPIAEKTAWINKYQLDEKKSVEDMFEELTKKSELDDNLTKYEARTVLMMLDEISKLGFRGYYPINIAYGINDKTVAKLEENKLELPGVKVSLEPVRYYPYGELASHTLGYIGKIAQEDEIKKYIKEKNYLPGTLIGKTGVEVKFEDYLKGTDGSRIVEADAHGNVVKEVKKVDAKPGDTLYLTIDAELQKITEESLEKALTEIRRGGTYKSKWGNFTFSPAYPSAYSASAVAMDVRTGEILALANYPSYDPNLFATGISSEDWQSLNPDVDEYGLPLYNIAIQSPVQPGSTFKMITGIAGMENGIKATKKIYDYGYVQLGDRKFSCLAWSSGRGSHGATDLYRALEKSCNYYFYAVALGKIPQTGEILSTKSGIDSILRVAKEFGLDEKTGIEVPGERIEGVPNKNSNRISNKALLERFLKSNIDKYIKEDFKLSEKDKEKAIKEITSWVEYEKPLDKIEVVRRVDKLGIDGERKLPGNREDLADIIKYTYLNQSGWSTSDSLNVSIGQGLNAYTPLQMANYISILSNGGYRHKISVIDKIQSYDNTKKTYQPKREVERIKIKDYKYLEEAAKGMSLVTQNEGTARRAFADFPEKVAAKTGTAERAGVSPNTGRKYDNYAWFTAYAPYEDYNPDAAQIAVSVVIFQGGSGGFASPIARDIIAQYLGLNNDSTESKMDLNNKLAK